MPRLEARSRTRDPASFVCYEGNHFSCLLQSTAPPHTHQRLAAWLEPGWKMSPSEVHEGVKLQTPLCPRPCATKGISSFIDRASWMCGGQPATSSSSPDCFCFQVTSYLLLQLFQFLRACCMKTEGSGVGRSLGNVHKPQLKDNPT